MKTHIAVIEDEFYTRKAICQYCAQLGEDYDVIGETDNGKEGLALLRTGTVDIAIVDINIPILNGLDMIEAAVAQGIATKIIVLTGYSEFRYAQTSVHMGVSDYLLKPLTYETLKNSVEHIAHMEHRQLLSVAQSNKHVNGLLRQQLATQLLNAQTDSIETELLRDFIGFPDAGGLYTVLNLQLYGDQVLASETQTLYLHLYERLEKCGYQAIYAQKDQNTVCFILYAGKSLCLPPLEPTLMDVGKSLFNPRWMQMKFSLSTPCKELAAIGNASLEADSLQKGKLFESGEPVIILTPENQSIFYGALFTEGDRRYLREILHNKRRDEVHSFLENKFALFQKEKANANSIYFFAVETMGMLYEMDGQRLRTENDQSTDDDYLSEDVFSIPHLDQLKRKIIAYANKVTEAKAENKTPYQALVKRIQAYIQQNLDDPGLCLDQIAHASGISVKYLCFVYRQQTDSTVGETIFHQRMNRAMSLIEQGEKSISALAQACGYNDTGYFGKCFRKKTSLTPKQYIELQKNITKDP